MFLYANWEMRARHGKDFPLFPAAVSKTSLGCPQDTLGVLVQHKYTIIWEFSQKPNTEEPLSNGECKPKRSL